MQKTEKPQKSKRFLISDDDESIARGLCRLIKGLNPNAKTDTATTPEQTLELLRKNTYNAVFINQRFKDHERTGEDVIIVARGEGYKEPIYLFSAIHPEEGKRIVEMSGATAYLDKTGKDTFDRIKEIAR